MVSINRDYQCRVCRIAPAEPLLIFVSVRFYLENKGDVTWTPIENRKDRS